jgi:putative transposase
MARTKRKVKALPTIWRCPDDLWNTIIQPLLMELDPPAQTGRPRTNQRCAMDGIIYHLRTGCQWNALPREFGDDSSVHRTFQRWIERGVLIEQCEELDGVDWQWQSADAAMGKARFGGITSAPTPPIVRKKARNAA